MPHFKEKRNISKLKLARRLRNKVVVHAVSNLKEFKIILREKEIKLPPHHKTPKKLRDMESLIGVEDTIHLSLGFDYNAQIFQWPFALLFKLDILKGCDFYKTQLIWSCYKVLIDYIYENDKQYFRKLQQNEKIAPILDKYLKTNRKSFDFWKIEKEIFSNFNNYKDKNKIIKLIMKKKRELLLPYPKSKIYSQNVYRKSEQNREIICKKSIQLNNPNFIGVYTKPKFVQEIKEISRSNNIKLIYDGRKIIRP